MWRLGVHTPTGAKVPELQDVMLQVEQEFSKLWVTQNSHGWIFVEQIHDNDGSHFDKNVFWLHVSVKDPTAVTKTKGKKVKLLDGL